MVIGAGRFGKALGGVLRENGHEVKYYDPIVFPEIKLETALMDTEVNLFVAPSRTAAETVAKLPKDTPLILASKGFWNERLFQEFTDFSILSGAAFAEDITEVAPRFGNEIVLTGTSQLCERLFSTEYLKVEWTRDVRGVLMCGSMKNIFAIHMGARSVEGADETEDINEDESNTRETEAEYRKIFHEMEDLLFENGADPGTVRLACGMADVILTCSDASRNFQFGRVMKDKAAAKKFLEENTVEGVSAVMQKSFSEVKIPETARIFKRVVGEIRNAIK